MDRVASYDYPIENNEEMNMENVRVEDQCFDQAEVSVGGAVQGTVVYLDFDPDDNGEGQTVMRYSSHQARKLAAALIKAAEYVEAEENE